MYYVLCILMFYIFYVGLITAGVIVFSRHCKINPDNVATPIAASLGDITSLALLSWISMLLYESIGIEKDRMDQ